MTNKLSLFKPMFLSRWFLFCVW